MITLEQYFMGREFLYPEAFTQQVQLNAQQLVDRVNALIQQMERSGIQLEQSPRSGSGVASGWRPLELNLHTPGAAPRSKHITGEAVDLYDPEGVIDDWCLRHLPAISHEIGLWMEHPSATKGWCHLQSVPPRSGNPVFYP